MKLNAIALALVFVASALVGAQDASPPESEEQPPWKLLLYTINAEDMKGEVSGLVDEGMMPVGFEIGQNGAMAMLLVQAGELDVAGWIITDHADWGTLEDYFVGGIRRGLVPMDISRVGDSLAVLWIDADLPIEGFRLHRTANTMDARVEAINAFQQQAFTLWGMSVVDDVAWYLFIKQPDLQRQSTVEVYGRDTAAITDGITGATASRWLPFAIAGNDDSYFVTYVR